MKTLVALIGITPLRGVTASAASAGTKTRLDLESYDDAVARLLELKATGGHFGISGKSWGRSVRQACVKQRCLPRAKYALGLPRLVRTLPLRPKHERPAHIDTVCLRFVCC